MTPKIGELIVALRHSREEESMHRTDIHTTHDNVAVVDGYLTDRVFLLTRLAGDVQLGPGEAVRLGSALIAAGIRAALRPRTTR